jgi:hypothetical protein
MFRYYGAILKDFIKDKNCKSDEHFRGLNFIIKIKSLKILDYVCYQVQAHIPIITKPNIN